MRLEYNFELNKLARHYHLSEQENDIISSVSLSSVKILHTVSYRIMIVCLCTLSRKKYPLPPLHYYFEEAAQRNPFVFVVIFICVVN